MTLPAGAVESQPQIIELRRLQMRNTQDNMVQRSNDYLANGYLPAAEKAGVKPLGFFASVIGEGSPFTLIVSQHASLQAWDDAFAKIAADKDFGKVREAYYSGPLQYSRMDVTLLRGFQTMPGIEVLQPRADKRTRIFELRTYESDNLKTLARKVRMFDEGEIALFRKLNMTPVFFGATIAGQNMPNLTYMLAYDDMAARDAAWSTFGTHPEWSKMKSQPGVSDAEVVSNISNSILRPLPFSKIR